jgi:hypothetical protein
VSALLKGETPPTPAMRGADVYNEETVSTREGLSYDHIVREYVNTRAKLVELVRQITEEMVTQKSVLPWGGEGSLEGIVQVFGSHEMEHAMDVKKIIDENRWFELTLIISEVFHDFRYYFIGKGKSNGYSFFQSRCLGSSGAVRQKPVDSSCLA